MHRMRQRVVCALAALCFAWLASVAATHLHIGPDADEGCAVCAAVVGKVAGPSAAPAIKLAPEISFRQAVTPNLHSRLVVLAVVLPPSCGPPYSS
jgi:hypothetical protein